MDKLVERLKVQFKTNRMLVYGMPFMTIVLLGPFVLRHFNEVRYKYRKVSQMSEEDLKQIGTKMTKSNDEISLESEYEKVKETLDIEHWEQKRGPRPWEEPVQKQNNK